MRPEVRPIEFTNGHAHFYGKNKVDSFEAFKCTNGHKCSKCSEAMKYVSKRPKSKWFTGNLDLHIVYLC